MTNEKLEPCPGEDALRKTMLDCCYRLCICRDLPLELLDTENELPTRRQDVANELVLVEEDLERADAAQEGKVTK